jgi:protease-4
MVHKKFEKNKSLLIGTILFLVLGFIALIILFMGFTAMLPSFMGQCVAVVDIDKPIMTETIPETLFAPGVPGSEDYAAVIRSLDSREDVAAVVIVFNSPGGSVVATREVYEPVAEMEKPTVSYFREVAASGAYYIASSTDYIVSEPNALTGSIGVVATFADLSGLLDQLGINVTSVTSGPHKDIGSGFRPMDEEEQNITQALVEEIYTEFKGVVFEHRGSKLNAALMNQTFDGRILSGRQAKEAGLVDQTGNKRDAIMKAADLANISYDSFDDIRVCRVETVGGEAALLNVETLFHMLKTDSGIKLSYK